MKSYTTTVGVKNWIGEEVVNIYEYSHQENNRYFQTLSFEKIEGYKNGNQKMNAVMQ
ncbi:hypothetical protein HZY62_19130 [Maribacter polysiphoniae]|uniref:Uncharacterized protein n=1 Tax=Maribacter polysiphoniae TaxID=429344 RepID=A0ABR7W6P7_9FLAO|nr:hypothetical protein [Maribacter polysiphoniae]